MSTADLTNEQTTTLALNMGAEIARAHPHMTGSARFAAARLLVQWQCDIADVFSSTGGDALVYADQASRTIFHVSEHGDVEQVES